MAEPLVSISIVSHSQAQLVANLLQDIQASCAGYALEVLLTLNLPESLPFKAEDYTFPIRLIQNPSPKGFAANHNAALGKAAGQYWVVLNPDIRLSKNPFPLLIEWLDRHAAALIAPVVVDGAGNIEDSFRKFPSPWEIIYKAMGGSHGGNYLIGNVPIFPDWVAGMFMLFRADAYKKIGGFDERYFLYYEDVDLCARLRLSNEQILVCPQVKVVHLARRDSHRHFRYKKMHIVSMLKYFLSFYSLRFWYKQLWRAG